MHIIHRYCIRPEWKHRVQTKKFVLLFCLSMKNGRNGSAPRSAAGLMDDGGSILYYNIMYIFSDHDQGILFIFPPRSQPCDLNQ